MEFDTKKVLKHAFSGLVGAIVVSTPVALMAGNHYDGQIDLLNQDISLLKNESLVKDDLIAGFENAAPVICDVCTVCEDPDYSEYVALDIFETVMDFIEDEIDEDVDVDYIVFEMEAKVATEAWINNEFIDWLKDEDFFDNGELLDNYRKSEVSVKKIYDAEVVDRDYEDKDAVIEVEVKLKAKEDGEDREYFKFLISMPFEGGVMEDEDVDVDYVDVETAEEE